MKKRNKVWRALLLVLMLAMLTSETAMMVSAAPVSRTAAMAAKNGWVKADGNYYYYVNGKKVVNAWKTISGKKYYFGADGARKTGWYTILSKGKCYYFDSKGVWNGKYKKISTTFVKKLDAVNKAAKAATTTGSAALKKTAVYLSNKSRYKYGRAPLGFDPVKAAAGWDEALAGEFLNTKTGSCYHHAAAFAYLAKRLTGYDTRICVGQACVFDTGKWQKHGWVEVKINGTWYIYDTNAMEFSTVKSGKWYYLKHSSYEGKYYKTEKTFTVTI